MRNPSFIADLQGVRAIAVIAVILSHAGYEWASGGYIGVDVFFVLSGYLITRLLIAEHRVSGRIFLVNFYARRLRRLLPALAVMVCFTTIVASLLLSTYEVRHQLASAPYAIAWLGNVYFALSNFDYFNELSSKDLFLHTWSLGVEEQFYLVWPFFLIFLFRNSGRSGSGKFFFISMGVILFISLLLSIYLTAANQPLAFYMMPSRIWQFSAGGMVAVAGVMNQGSMAFVLKKFLPSKRVLVLVGLLTLFFCVFFFHGGSHYPGLYAMVPTVATILFLLATLNQDEINDPILSNPLMIWLGDRSYSLYLWHWPVLTLGFSLGFYGNGIYEASLLMLTIIISMFSYSYVETPFWRGRFSIIKPYFSISYYLFFSLLIFIPLFFYIRSFPLEDSSGLWRSDLPEIYRQGCDLDYSEFKPKICKYGDDELPNKVVLLGDSIGAQWFSAVHLIFSDKSWQIHVITKSACGIVDAPYYNEKAGGRYHACEQWRKLALDYVAALSPDVVLIGSASGYELTEEEWEQGTLRMLDRLSGATRNIYVLPGTPRLGVDGPGCVSRHARGGTPVPKSCPSPLFDEKSERVRESLQRAVNRVGNAKLVRVDDLVCPDRDCRGVNKHGVVVFRDSQHLTDSFVRSVSDQLSDRFLHNEDGAGR